MKNGIQVLLKCHQKLPKSKKAGVWSPEISSCAMRAVLWAALGALLCEAVLDDTYYRTLGVPTDASTLQVRPCPALRHPTPSLRRC